MKRIIILLAITALILVGCSEAEVSMSENQITSEYIETAHDQLENYTPSDTVIESSEESSLPSDSSDISDSSNTSDASDLPEESVVSEIETSDFSDSSEVSIEESTEESEEEEANDDIFLINADIAYDDGSAATLVCTIDGGINLYFGNGVNFLNMEEKEDCVKKAQELFDTCNKYLENAVKVEDYPLPPDGYTYIYMKTANGVYRLEFTNTEIHIGMEGELEIRILNAINCITKYAAE